MYDVDLNIVIKKLKYMQKVMKYHPYSTWDFFFSIVNKKEKELNCCTETDFGAVKFSKYRQISNINTFMRIFNYNAEIVVYKNTVDFYIIDKNFYISGDKRKDVYLSNLLQDLIEKKKVDSTEMELLNFEFNLLMKGYKM